MDVDVKTNRFYCDQQSVLVWFYDETNGVYVQVIGSSEVHEKNLQVAKTLPEFFTRVWCENQIWYAATMYDDDDVRASVSTFFKKDYDAERVFGIMKKVLSDELLQYIKPYYNSILAEKKTSKPPKPQSASSLTS